MMNKISRSFIEQINQISTVEFMESEYESDFIFNKSSKWANTNCPMPNHDDSSPSFGVNTESNIFNCFGCGAKGDIIKLVQLVEGLNFYESIQRIANYANIDLELADLDLKNIIRELSKNIESYLNNNSENRFPGGLSEISFLIAFSDRTKGYLKKTNFDNKEIEWVDSIYNTIESYISQNDFKSIDKIWNNFSKETKLRLTKK